MPNPVKWVANVGKSIGYSMMDQIKEANPTIVSFKEDNAELFKSIKNTIKFKGMKDIGSSLEDNKYFKIAQEGIDNLKEDLRTGKLYNKEREKESYDKAAASWMGFDDSDFGFGDDDFGFGDMDDLSSSIEDSTMSTNDMMDIVGEKTSTAISSAVIGSSEYIVKSGRKNTQSLFKQNNILFTRLHNDMNTINANIGSILDFSKEATTTHYNNSATFFTTMTSKMDENNSLLKELVEMQKELYGKKEGSPGYRSSGNKFSDIEGSSGLPNFSAWLDLIKKNVKENSMFSLIDMGMDMGLGTALTSTPGKFISDAIAKVFIPAATTKVMSAFNESLSSIFPNMMLKLLQNAGDFGIKGFLSEILGVDNQLKTSLDVRGYKKDAVPFDGVTRKAITEVIPTYLSKILQSMTNGKETRYNYNTGKFVTLEDIRKEYNEITSDNARYAFSDVDSLLREYAGKIKFDKDDTGNFITKEQFSKNLQEFYQYQYKNSKVFNDRTEKKIDASTYGLSGGAKAEISAKLMTEMWKNLPEHEKMKIAREIISRRDSQTRYLEDMEREGTSPATALFNNSSKLFGVSKYSKVDNAAAAGKYNSSILNVLVDIRKEVSYIRQYGLSGNKTVRDNRGTYRTASTIESFDSFSPYESPVIKEEDPYYPYIADNSALDKKDEEAIDEYGARAMSEYRQAKDTEARADRKKGYLERFLGLFGQRAGTVGKNIDTVIRKPMDFITRVIKKADQAVYSLVFGREEGNGEQDKGILQRIGDNIKDLFDTAKIWLKEHIFQPLKERFTKEKIKNATKRFFGFFGVDIEQVGKDIRRFFFGEKDENKNRTKNGLFGGFIDSVKNTFKDVFGWVKGSAKEVYENEDLGLKDAISGTLNEKGKAKQEEINKDRKKASKDRSDISDILDGLNVKKDEIFQKAKERYEKKKEEEEKENDKKVNGSLAAGIKRVPKTGIYALSEGEAVIPPDYNPANIKKRYSNEQRAIDKFKKHGGINMLASGTDPEVELTEEEKKELAAIEKEQKDWEAYREEITLDRSDYEESNPSIMYRTKDQLGKVGQFIKGLFGDIMDKSGNIDKDRVKLNVIEITDGILGDVKDHLPELTTGSIIGAGTSLITGMIGGPIVGAAVGAGVGLLVRSKNLQDLLFGPEVTDEDGNTTRQGGVLPKNISDFILKYGPTMGKGAALGGILGTVAKFLPMIPGGPITGILVGSTLGYAAKNDKIHNYLFGEEGKLKGLPEKLKSLLPKMGAGAIVGAIANPIIPGGFLTNMLMGSAIGFVTDTEKFKDAFWGVKDKNGNRTGGIYEKIVTDITKPVKSFLKENVEYFSEWFQNTIKRNISDFFKPLKKSVTDLGKNIIKIFKNMGNKFTESLKENIFNKFFRMLEKTLGISGGIFKFARNFITKTVGLPFNIVGGIGRRWQAGQVRKGKATYMKTAAERLKFREDNRVSRLFKKDRALGLDKTLNEMNTDEIDLALRSVQALRDGGKSADKEFQDTKNKLSVDILQSNLSRDDKDNVVKLLKSNNINGIRSYLKDNKIDTSTSVYINDLLDKSEKKLANAKYVKDQFDNGEGRTALESALKDTGIDVKKIKNLDNIEEYLLNERKDRESKISDDLEVKAWRVDIYETLEKSLNALLSINDRLDPSYNLEDATELDDYAMGQQADIVRRKNYKNRKDNLTDEDREKENESILTAAGYDNDIFNAQLNNINRKASKQRRKNELKELRTNYPEDFVSLPNRVKSYITSDIDSLKSGYKSFTDNLNGYYDENYEDISKIDRISRMLGAKINVGTPKDIVLNPKNEEIEKDSNSTEKDNLFDKFKSYMMDEESDKYETSYYNGIAIRNKVDENGNVEADMSDSETVKAIREREEDRNTQKGILNSITNIPSKIGEFFGIDKDKEDKEPKKNILGKIMKWAGMGMLALMVAPKVAEFVKNTAIPVIKETIIPAITKIGIDFKNGIMEGFFGESDHEGGLANKLGEKIGESAKWITDTAWPWVTDTAIPAVARTIEDLLSKAIPWLAEQLVQNIPGLIRGIGEGLGKLGSSITDALANKKVYSPEDIVGVNSATVGGINSINTSVNDVGYTPSNKWNTTGKTFAIGSSNGSLGKDQYGNGVQVVDSSVEKDTATEYSNLKGTKDTSKLPKAYTEIGEKKLNKFKSTIDEVLDDNIIISTTNPETGETTTKTMSGYDLLNSDDIVYWTKTENRDGTYTNTGIRGYELLNNSTVAKDILGIDLKTTQKEKEEAAKEEGYDNGNSLFNITTDNPFHRAARAVFSSIRHGGSTLGVQGIKGVKRLFDITKHIPGLKNISRLGGALASGTAKVAEFGSKIIPTVANGISKLPDVIKKANDKFIDSGKLGFLKRFKDFITNVFKNSTIINKISNAIGKPIKKVTSALANLIPTISKEVGEELAENAAKTAAKSLFKKVFAIAAIVYDFQAGYKNAANIAQILEDLCTPPIKVVAGLVNVITEQFTFGFVNPTTVFNLILNGLKSLFDDKDILDIDKKRDETDKFLLEYEEKEGIKLTPEDYNKKYNKDYTEYNVARSQAQSLGLYGDQANQYIENSMSKDNIAGQKELDKTKQESKNKSNQWWDLYNSKDNTIKDKQQFAMMYGFQGYDETRGFYGGANGVETGPDPGKLATGTPYVPNSGLYALSKGELVIPKLAEGTNPFGIFSDIITKSKELFSSSKLEDNIKNIYKYANSGDDKFFKEDSLSTDPTSKTINAIAKKLFTPVYAVEKMQNYFVKSLNDELGDGDKVLELFNTQLAETNKYLTGDLSMKNYWNDKLDDNKSMYGNMAKVITNIYKSLQFPMILAKSLFQVGAGRSSNDSGNVDAVSTQNSTANVSASSISADLSSISVEGTTSTNNTGSTTLGNIKNIMNNIDLTGKIPEGSSGDQYKHLVVKYGEKNVIPFKNRDNKVVGYRVTLKNGKTKYIAASKNAAVTGYVPGKKSSSVVHSNPNSMSGYTANGSGLFVGAGSKYEPIPIEGPANSVSDIHYKYSKILKIKPIINPDNTDQSTENITSTGDNFVSQVDANVANISFKSNKDTIRQTVSTSGCAPAAATMVINSLRGKDIISMNTATKDAIPYKVPNGGVTSTYFDDEFSKYGIGTDYLENNSNDPNKSYIVKAIRERRPTILLGQDTSNRNKNNSPFGPNPHYVVADSISKDGKYIFINDPESKKPRIRYLLKSILPKVKVGISTFLGKGGRKLNKLFIGSAKAQVKAPYGDYIGKNVKRFESGDSGPKATGSCGNDGGGSYGSFQMIYSGSAKMFWSTYFGSKYGNPTSPSDLNAKWLKAVNDLGESAFFAKEWKYVLENYYKPTVSKLKSMGFDPDNYSRSMQECIWAWAIHRGSYGCCNEFKEVIQILKDPMNADETTLINTCYDVRGSHMTGKWTSIATGRYGTGADSERVVALSLVGQPPIDYTAPDGVLFAGSAIGTDNTANTAGNDTGDGEYKSILDILLAPFDLLATQYKLTGSNNNNTTSAGTTEYNADGISGPVSSDPAIAQKQVQVVAKMKSVYGQLKYGQDNEKYPLPRDPDTGSGDCSSTVQWAYQKTLGVDVGSWSGGQAESSNTYVVDGGHSSGAKTDESKLQLGDIMLYGPGGGKHAEMYFGHGKVLTHGNPSALGPVTADINRRVDYWGTKRLNSFRSNGTSNYDSSASTTFNTGQNAHNNQNSMSGYVANGSGLVGRGSFVSQLDPKYANKRFNNNGDTIKQTIGDSGCAPAAATMVLNDIAGRASMMDSSKLALQYKDTNDGVSADYFGDIYGRHGLNTNYYNRKEQVTSDLYNGKDVVLLGSDRNNRSKSNSPFGPNPHYVVASGISKDGKSITIKDPEAKRPKKYNASKILNSTRLGIGYGSGLLNKVLKKFKGKGFGSFSGILYVGDSRVDGMKDCIHESGVYFICKGSMGLQWLKRSTVRSQIASKVKADPNLAVIFNLGVNDLYNKNNYINTYKEIKAAHPNVKFFFMSVNPVDNDPYATDAEIVDFNNTMKSYWGSDYLDVYSYLKSDGYKTTDGTHYDNATSMKIHKKCKEMISGTASNTTTTGTTTVDTSEESVLDRILGSMGNVAVQYHLVKKVGNDSGSTGTNTTTTSGTVTGSGEFPKYALNEQQIKGVANILDHEQPGLDGMMAEASLMANLVDKNGDEYATVERFVSKLQLPPGQNWFAYGAQRFNNPGNPPADAIKAAKEVIVNGKRTLPRYVDEHDCFSDITSVTNNGQSISKTDRSSYVPHVTKIKNRWQAYGTFHSFPNSESDPFYYTSDALRQKWGDNCYSATGSGSGLVDMPKYEYKQKYSGRASGFNNISEVFDTFTNAIESNTAISSNNVSSSTTNSGKDIIAMMKSIIKLLAKVVDNTDDITDIISILSKLVDLQSTTEKTGEVKSNIKDLKRQLTDKLNNQNRANIGSGDLYNLMSNIEDLATE